MNAVTLGALLGLALSSAGLDDEAAAARYEAAAEAYARGEAKRASAELWSLVHALEAPSWRLWLDAALAAETAAEPGRAVAAALQALRRRPLDRLALDTLEAARRARRDHSASPLTSPSILATLALGRAEHLWLLLTLYAATALALGVRALRRTTGARAAFAGLAVATALTAGTYLVRWVSTEPLAVVVETSVTARMGPSLDALGRFELGEADVTQWLEVRGDFVRIRAAEAGEGWVPRASVELIDR